MSPRARVLSFQSHVVYGCVGNKAATFPLQCLGFDVDPFNAVHFSNHSGYPKMLGTRLTTTQFQEIVEGLEANHLLGEYSHLLTGYVGQAAILELLPQLVEKMTTANPELQYDEVISPELKLSIVLDPVMGDNGKLYVPEETIPVYRKLCAVAHAITPNGFEAGLLAQTEITDLRSLSAALEILHGLGTPLVIVTSATIADFPARPDSFPPEETMYMVASHSASSTRFAIPFRMRDGFFTGTGDLFSALIVANLPPSKALTGDALKSGCEVAMRTLSSVLDTTLDLQAERARGLSDRVTIEGNKAVFMRTHELAVVQSRDAFLNAKLLPPSGQAVDF
ncbi:hypothetical protein HKX48_008282 [Thoreauomyces humboldtii]|nr:hypothetical protein HKX48_008282 [Thoreauomyces humboldtii]